MGRYPGFNRYMEWNRGFRGWFVFFFVVNCLGALVYAFLLVMSGRVLAQLSTTGAPFAVIIGSWLQAAIHAGAMGGILYGLWLFAHEDPVTPRFWTLFCLAQAGAYLASQAITAYRLAALSGGDWTSLFNGEMTNGGWTDLLVLCAWSLYWARSNRVRNTYGYCGLGSRSTTTHIQARESDADASKA